MDSSSDAGRVSSSSVSGLIPLIAGDIKWAWKVVDNRIKHQLNTLVLEGRTTQYWEEFNVDSCFTDSSFQFFVSDFFTFEVFHHQVFISFSDCFNQFFTVFLSLVKVFSWNIFFKDICSKVVSIDFSFSS